MEFSKKEIHTSVLTQSKYSQITVDDDFTIPDSKGDMEKIVAKEGHILLESMIPEDGPDRSACVCCIVPGAISRGCASSRVRFHLRMLSTAMACLPPVRWIATVSWRI